MTTENNKAIVTNGYCQCGLAVIYCDLHRDSYVAAQAAQLAEHRRKAEHRRIEHTHDEYGNEYLDAGGWFAENENPRKMKTEKIDWQHVAELGAFSHAARLAVSARVRKIITSQPGYQRNRGPYTVSQTLNSGGYRLFCSVEGRWMDASLSDLDE